MIYEGRYEDDNFRGTNGADEFRLSEGGVDMAQGRGGDDLFYVDEDIELGDRFDGGNGHDFLRLNGQIADGFVFDGDTCANFERIDLNSNLHTTVMIKDGCDPLGHHVDLTVSGKGVHIDASAVTGTLTVEMSYGHPGQCTTGSGDDMITGGLSRDVIDGGAGNDTIIGGIGIDTLTGGAGADVFVYNNLYHSEFGFYYPKGDGKDTVTDFDVSEDKVSIVSDTVHSYQDLDFEDDGHGGTMVVFSGRQSIDLEHVKRHTLSESNFVFSEPAATASAGGHGPHHVVFGPPPPHATLADMISAHAGFGDLHAMAHMAIA